MGGHLSACTGLSRALQLDPVRLRDAGGAVGRLAVLRARLAVADHAQSQHVHADRHGHRRRLCSTASSPRSRPAIFPPRSAATAAPCGLFRGRQHDHRAGAARPGSRTARARSDLRRHPRAARSRAKDGAPRKADGSDEEVPLDAVAGRRPLARAARRQGAGRRRRARRPLRAR